MNTNPPETSPANSHVSPPRDLFVTPSDVALSAVAELPERPDETSLSIARSLLPPSVADRKFRAHSFAAQLGPDHWAMLSSWLFSGDSIEQVRQKVAAPPPQGFGLDVNPTTLRRLKRFFENADAADRIADSMDTASDILNDPAAGQVAPLREALSLLLYSRALEAAKNEAGYVYMESMLNLLTKLERLKPASQSRREPAPPATTRHKVELSIVSTPAPASAPEPPKIVNITATPLPNQENQQSEPNKESF